jgi:hypothetical protein
VTGEVMGGVRELREASLRGVQRRLAELLQAGDGMALGGQPPIEASRALATEPPRLVAAPVIEGHALRAHRVRGEATPEFAAFLDGTQQSHVARYEAGMPIVFGTVAAVVRVRRNRRLVTWGRGPLVARSVYAPRAHLPAAAVDAVFALGVRVVDTTLPDLHGEIPPAHPLALLERAVHSVQADREQVERELAEAWCRAEDAPLFVDGSIQGSERVATAPCVAGVVKTHRTLYAEGDALRVVLALPVGHRSSVFRVAIGRRTPVASWYLRLRDPAGRDPMWGLVRVEAALPDAADPAGALAERADLVSRRVLAEVSPLALPDGRWDKMVYGIRDCEEFLRAVC